MKCKEFWVKKYCAARAGLRGKEESAKVADEAFQNWLKYVDEAEGILYQRSGQVEHIMKGDMP